MIISASRRTDIPAFYSTWLMNRIRAGFCKVVNPFNPNQKSRISLVPQDVDIIVFWTRNALPLLKHLDELDRRGYFYYFLYTVTPYENVLEGKTPALEQRIKAFVNTAHRIGRERIVWRYDPILIGTKHDFHYHEEKFKYLAEKLSQYTSRVIVSFVDYYKKTERNLAAIDEAFEHKPEEMSGFAGFINNLVECARAHEMDMSSCAETRDLQKSGILPGKCIDDEYIRRIFGQDVSHRKDPNQRKECRCVVSKDIGVYNTCIYNCRYCYATAGYEAAKRYFAQHNPDAPALGHFS